MVCCQALHRANFKPSASSLSLARHGMSKLAIKAFLEAVTGTGQHLDESACLDMYELRVHLEDNAIVNFDVSSNDIQVAFLSVEACLALTKLLPVPCSLLLVCALSCAHAPLSVMFMHVSSGHHLQRSTASFLIAICD